MASPSADSKVSLVIMDDNPGSLELLSTALAQEGLAIFTALDPAETWDSHLP